MSETRRNGHTKRAARWILAACALAAPAAAQDHGPRAPERAFRELPTIEPVSTQEAAAWRSDLDQLTAELARRHGDLYHSIPRPEFEASVDRLHDRIPTLARHEIVVEMQRIAASIGDGHTNLSLLFDPAVGFHALPLRLGWFEEGLFVEATSRARAGIVGGRVVAVGGVPVDEAVDRVTPLISRDNDIWIRAMAPQLLSVTEVLHAVGLSQSPIRARLTVEQDGARREVSIDAGREPFVLQHGAAARLPRDEVDARDSRGERTAPGYRDRHLPYWSEYLPDHDALYIQYNQVNNAPDGPGVHAFFVHALDGADARAATKLILDIRNNSGGEGMLNFQVVREIVRRPRLDRPGSLFVIIGRRTFSAAQMLAHMLDQYTEAIFLGEPTGSSPQFWGDHEPFRLERSGIQASASPTWWQPGGPYDERPYLPPLLAFEPRWSDYVDNRDPAVEAALEWGERPDLGERLITALRDPAGGRENATAIVRAWSADPVHRYQRATAVLNRAGYALLREGRREDALAVFQLNVAVHPDYANGWDSLGETLMAAGRHREGLDAYRRAYELDPDVGNAARVLRAASQLPDRP